MVNVEVPVYVNPMQVMASVTVFSLVPVNWELVASVGIPSNPEYLYSVFLSDH